MKKQKETAVCSVCKSKVCKGKTLYICKDCSCKFCDECGNIEERLCNDCLEDVDLEKDEAKEITHDVEEFTQEQD